VSKFGGGCLLAVGLLVGGTGGVCSVMWLPRGNDDDFANFFFFLNFGIFLFGALIFGLGLRELRRSRDEPPDLVPSAVMMTIDNRPDDKLGPAEKRESE
jgi:hypothetical protein